tara:strand:+ start:203 stop:1510 length:1308 start_codon:yes stop_codon:yes gene_type:complete
MSFFWYIDIAESSYATEQINPDFLPPVNNTGAPGNFSVGPMEFATGQKLSVYDLVQKIQAAFDTALSIGLTQTPYYIEARSRKVDIFTGAAELNGVAESKELIIEYKIFNEENISFSMLFRSGEHGSAGNQEMFPSNGPPIAEVTVINKPNIRAIATPYCSLTSTITDKPPVPPDVVFVPYVGVNNKVLVLFNSNAGEREETPIILRNTDISFILEEYFSQHQIDITAESLATGGSQSYMSDQKKLTYRNDDPIRKYELFKIAEKPTSYDSFKGFNVTDAPIEAKIGPDKFSTAVAFVDRLQPNRTYWYCARSIDIHNNISNPTYIFELEMVDNRGQLFLRQKVFMFEPATYKYTKPGRRFLAIRPKLAQTVFDPEVSSPTTVGLNETPDSDILGSADVVDKVWNKKFKVRLTSKKTGRKIDLNLTFKNTGVVIP